MVEEETVEAQRNIVHVKWVLLISSIVSFVVVMTLSCLGHIYLVNMFTKARLKHMPKAKKVKVKKGKKKKGKKGKKSKD